MASSSSTRPVAVLRASALLPWLFLAACLATSLHFSRIGWDLPLTENWRFRETQTALGARDLVENGFRIDYETPVLGAPWSIPFEFPTYQFCVAALVKVTGLPLESAGRATSLAFAYAAFAVLGIFVWRVSRSRAAGIYSAALALVSPVYLYGSRAFMIESTALCFTLALLLGVQEFLRHPSSIRVLAVLAAGLVAGPTKATTYAVGLVGVAGLIALHSRDLFTQWRNVRATRPLFIAFVVALAVPFVATLAWTHHTDQLKLANGLAGFLTSSSLREWNFGTLAQRLDFSMWDRMIAWVSNFVLGTPLVWIVGVALLAVARVQHTFGLVLLASFASGILVFTNLYVIHEYYHYANGVYLLAIFGLGLGALWDRATVLSRFCCGFIVAPLLAGLMVWSYVHRSLPQQLYVETALLDLAKGIKQCTPVGSTILVYGSEWESTLPYYAERRAIMERYNLLPTDPTIKAALARLDHPLGGVVFTAYYTNDWGFIIRQIHGLATGRQRLFASAWGQVYAATDSPALASPAWKNAGFADAPDVFGSAFQVIDAKLGGQPAMMVHAPGFLVFQRTPTTRTITGKYGITEAAYTAGNQTDGVTFVAEFVDEQKRHTRLWERRLNPTAVPADRGVQSFEVPVPDRGGAIILSTETGPTANCDWAVFRDVTLH
jgi:hypothetical protein